MSNFLFIQTEFPTLYAAANNVEKHTLADPRAACFYARFALESAVEWIFDFDKSLPQPFQALNDNLHELKRLRVMPIAVWEKARLIQKIGNSAVHGGVAPTLHDSRAVAREFFHLMFWIARTYAQKKPFDGLTWDETKLPIPPAQIVQKSRAQIEALARSLQTEREEYRARLEASEERIKELEALVEKAKKAASETEDKHDYSEKETRDLLIDFLLKESGWKLDQKRDREFPVLGMPNNKGEGFVDYVLWGDDGLPLAVVEAKRTRKGADVGQEQARQYANCLENKFGRRPLIFYTNGYETKFWDDLRYPPREVQGFYKKDELERLIAMRETAPPTSVKVDEAIVGRAYQTRAIRKVMESLELRKRKGLLVMATGTGKTRVSIALVDALIRAGWVKRVLFLADRRALVRQTVNAFKQHLPGSNPVNLVEEQGNTAGASVFVSTYPTMMSQIEKRDELGARLFGVGHFDLVIIDEAHRSVYQKYSAIFEYFDSLLLGLTATPRDEIDRDTFRLFDLKAGDATDAYGLEEAISDGFLVRPRRIKCDLRFPREGIKYNELSEEEKAEWDAKEWGEDGPPNQVESGAVNTWLFNIDTVDKVLETLMTQGIRIDGGDKLGKTIIFAKSHLHAVFIVERFNVNYPHLGSGNFCRVIDNEVNYAQALIDDFATVNKMPQIAVSVDMLDTGIDVPEIVNLVFFKPVRSRTKFWQMMGRGTRLRPDLFGPNLDKREFLAFDFCGNFEFFEEKPDGIEGSMAKTLGQRLFERRLALLRSAPGAENEALRHSLADQLHAEVAAMNTENFVVRPHLRAVEKWCERENWNDISDAERDEIYEHLVKLPTEFPTDGAEARQFDDLMLRLQLALLNVENSFARLQIEVRELAANLLEKTTIPFVTQKEAFLIEISGDSWWQDVTLSMLEEARIQMRELVQFADKAKRPLVISDFEDSEVETTDLDGDSLEENNLEVHKRRVRAFVEEHKRNHPTIIKLRENQPLSIEDLNELDRLLFEASGFSSREEFEDYFGPQPELGKFVRSLVGINREAAKRAFAPFLQSGSFTGAQMDFLNNIIDYVAQNGTIKSAQLYRAPFTNHPDGIEGIFPRHYDQILSVVRSIERNAIAA
jgi:type I restriction enzyme R subunit